MVTNLDKNEVIALVKLFKKIWEKERILKTGKSDNKHYCNNYRSINFAENDGYDI